LQKKSQVCHKIKHTEDQMCPVHGIGFRINRIKRSNVKNWVEIFSYSVLKTRLSSSSSRDTDIPKKNLILNIFSLSDAISTYDSIPEPSDASTNEMKTTEMEKI
jgi:hypothetical protein